AYCTLLFAAISVVSYGNAYLVFMGMNLVLLAISWWLMRPWVRDLEQLWSWFPALLFFSFYPVSAALLQGQDSILFLALIAGSLVLASRRRDLAAGMVLGLGLFKFQIVIPMAILFVLWRRWRFSIGFLVSASALSAVSIGIVGASQSVEYFQLLAATKD